MINISVCLSDIPSNKRIKSETNGKIYANFTVSEKKQVDKYGNTHSVAMAKTKEEREAKAETIYIGSGKEFIFKTTDNRTAQELNDANNIQPQSDDLPF
jgi:hypothetical protein